MYAACKLYVKKAPMNRENRYIHDVYLQFERVDAVNDRLEHGPASGHEEGPSPKIRSAKIAAPHTHVADSHPRSERNTSPRDYGGDAWRGLGGGILVGETIPPALQRDS